MDEMIERLRWEALESSGHNRRARELFLQAAAALAAQPAAPVGEPVAMLEKLWSQIWDKRPPGDPKDTYRELRALLAAPPPCTQKVRIDNE